MPETHVMWSPTRNILYFGSRLPTFFGSHAPPTVFGHPLKMKSNEIYPYLATLDARHSLHVAPLARSCISAHGFQLFVWRSCVSNVFGHYLKRKPHENYPYLVTLEARHSLHVVPHTHTSLYSASRLPTCPSCASHDFRISFEHEIKRKPCFFLQTVPEYLFTILQNKAFQIAKTMATSQKHAAYKTMVKGSGFRDSGLGISVYGVTV